MRSIKESFGFFRTTSSIDGMPRSAAGILPHQEEEQLNNLWINIRKSEDAYLHLSSEASKCRDALREIHETEEKLVKSLSDSNIGIYSSSLTQIVDEYLSVVIETKSISDEASSVVHEVMGSTPEQYHFLYEPLDALRKKRDSLISEIQKSQEKLDRFKLKGKRTTDLIVERDRNLRNLKEINLRLIQEAQQFHDIRISFLETCLHASVQNQISYYGHITKEYNKYVIASRGSHQIKDKIYDEAINTHLSKIKELKIVEQ